MAGTSLAQQSGQSVKTSEVMGSILAMDLSFLMRFPQLLRFPSTSKLTRWVRINIARIVHKYNTIFGTINSLGD